MAPRPAAAPPPRGRPFLSRLFRFFFFSSFLSVVLYLFLFSLLFMLKQTTTLFVLCFEIPRCFRSVIFVIFIIIIIIIIIIMIMSTGEMIIIIIIIFPRSVSAPGGHRRAVVVRRPEGCPGPSRLSRLSRAI